jgi:hypothetical protein
MIIHKYQRSLLPRPPAWQQQQDVMVHGGSLCDKAAVLRKAVKDIFCLGTLVHIRNHSESGLGYKKLSHSEQTLKFGQK